MNDKTFTEKEEVELVEFFFYEGMTFKQFMSKDGYSPSLFLLNRLQQKGLTK